MFIFHPSPFVLVSFSLVFSFSDVFLWGDDIIHSNKDGVYEHTHKHVIASSHI